ncbi:MAG: ferritin family protein [Desulfuromonadales bacterium]|jgi:rubrerythrin
MFEKVDVQEAVKRSMQTEKNAMDFYRLGAQHMKNEEAKRTFELLAGEEKEHAEWFWKIYTGTDIPDFESFIAGSPEKQSDWLSDLEKIILPDFNERKAMELAMDKELKLEKSLREMAAKISDPKVRQVFEANAVSTHNHFVLIESEYARLMGMVHETDIDTYVRE